MRFLSHAFPPPPSSLVWFELGILGTEVHQSSPTQRSGFQFNWFCPGGGRLLVLGLFLGPVRCGRGQMRVSWCQRLDGRMLSTFSMMKFRGANSVLRNCRNTETTSVFNEKLFFPSNLLRLIYQLKSNRRSQTKTTQRCRNDQLAASSTAASFSLFYIDISTFSLMSAALWAQAPPGLVLRCVLATAREVELGWGS